jgi:hypothetical protein
MLGFLVCMGFQAAFGVNLRNILVAINGGKSLYSLRNGLNQQARNALNSAPFFRLP